MIHEIEVQWPDKLLGEAHDFARHFGCEAHKTKSRFYYRITTDDPINFYWLGVNVNNAAINAAYPSAVSKFIEL